MKLNINSKNINAIFYLAIVALVFLVYGNTLQHDYNLDDSYYINILPKSDGKPVDLIKVLEKRFSKSDYRPIPTFHLAVEQFIFGQKPTVFHFFNVLYYAVLGIALYLLLNQLKIFPKKWMVLLLVTLFLIHPSHSNVVASIKNRDVILSMLYGVLGIISFLKFADKKNYLHLVISIALFFISILSKADGVMFPIIGMILIYFSRNIKWRKPIIVIIAVLALVVGLQNLSTQYVAEEAVEVVVTDYFENPLVENKALFGNLPLKLYLTNFYHKFMIVPNGYYFYFGYNQIKIPKTSAPLVIISTIAHLLLLIILIGLLIRRKKGILQMGLTIYFIALLPLILFLDATAGIVAVRYSFYASLGFSIVLVASLMYLLNAKTSLVQISGKILIGFILVSYAYLTIVRNSDWKNKETLFTHDLKYLNDSYMANRMGGIHFNFLADKATISAKQKEQYLSSSEKYLNRAKAIYDKDPVLWHNLGLLYVNQEEYKQAFFSFKNAISLDSTNTTSWNFYGNFCELANDLNRAEEAYKQIVSLEPENELGYKNLTFVLIGQQKFEEALGLNKQLLTQTNMKKFGYENLGHIYMAVQDTTNAILNFNKAFDAGLNNELLKRDIENFAKN